MIARKSPKPGRGLLVPTWVVFAGGIAAFAGGFLPPVTQSLAARAQTATPQTTQAQGRQGPQPDGRGRGDGQRSGGPGRGGEWFWRDDALKKQVGLTDAQAARIEAYFQKTNKDTSTLFDEFVAHSKDLDAAVSDRKVSTDDLTPKIVAVEALRSKLSQSRTLMSYRIDLMLTAEQFKKLQDLRDAHPRPPRRGDWQWWKDDAKRLGLSESVSAEIGRIYDARQKRLGPLVTALQQTQTDVDAIRHTRSATPEQLEPKVVTLETLRSRLNESRTVMLYQFNQKLTPEQYARLQQLVEEHVGGGRRGGGSGPKH